jgi:hypothetical protein
VHMDDRYALSVNDEGKAKRLDWLTDDDDE